LKRKYLKQISEDQDIFTQCTDTIIRQVGDIGRMVDEFSAFARMPAADMKTEDLCEIVRAAIFAEEFAHRSVDYIVQLPDTPANIRCDIRHVNRLLTNILQNALEAIDGRPKPEEGEQAPSKITVSLGIEGTSAVLEVADNGIGLPSEGRERLTEPYVTNREKGTGLGLAIVKKIMEEHGAHMRLEDAEGGGAQIRLSFHLAERLGHPDVEKIGVC